MRYEVRTMLRILWVTLLLLTPLALVGCVEGVATCEPECPEGSSCVDEVCVQPTCTMDCGSTGSCAWVDNAMVCECLTGYVKEGESCVDIDECADKSFCAPGEACMNTDGAASCACRPGFVPVLPPGKGCTDACTPNPCENEGQCTVTQGGSFSCQCPPGWSGDTCTTAGCDLDTCSAPGLCEVKACNGATCQLVPKACDDGASCTDDSCDAVTGECVYASNCDDNDQCTTDTCEGSPGDCVFTANNNVCDDGNTCTSNDICTGGSCGGMLLDCDDNDQCTADSCADGSCVTAPKCSGGGTNCTDSCDPTNGECIWDTCDDGDACTIDSCNTALGTCANSPACVNGACAVVSGQPVCQCSPGWLGQFCDTQCPLCTDTCTPFDCPPDTQTCECKPLPTANLPPQCAGQIGSWCVSTCANGEVCPTGFECKVNKICGPEL